MNKFIVGALVCAAVAGIILYLMDPEKFTDVVDDVKSKADDALSKAKSTLRKTGDDIQDATASSI